MSDLNGEKEEKRCFVIMPIADTPDYDSGHFNTVYKHLILPACRKAGFIPIRADEVNSSNMIMLDILKNIVQCDLAICDLSSRNPNVMYELGLRQAFNKKTVLLKDNVTISPFDVQGFRYCLYDSKLQVNTVSTEIELLSNSIISTYEAIDDVNSIVQLLKIEPANIGKKTKLSREDTILLNAITSLTNKVNSLHRPDFIYSEALAKTAIEKMNFRELIMLCDGETIAKNRFFETPEGEAVGFFKGRHFENDKFYYVFENKNNELIEIEEDDKKTDVDKLVQCYPY